MIEVAIRDELIQVRTLLERVLSAMERFLGALMVTERNAAHDPKDAASGISPVHFGPVGSSIDEKVPCNDDDHSRQDEPRRSVVR